MTEVIIIGAGIAGLGAGLVGQKLGKSVPIYDKGKGHTCDDNLLWIAPNGLKMLDSLGLMDKLARISTPQRAMIFARQDLKPLLSMRASALIESHGFPILAVKRGALYRLLLEEFTARGGLVHFDHELKTLQQSKLGVTLQFRGKGEVSCDYVVAADGIGSTVRNYSFPESHVAYQGLRTYLGKSKSPAATMFVGETVEIWGVGKRFVVTSLDGQTAYWSAIERSDVYVKNSAPLPENLLSQLKVDFESFHPSVRILLEDAIPESIHRCNFGVVSGLPAFEDGRVALIGDAAHGMPPNMGQGASLALEDASYVMTKLFAEEDGNSMTSYAAKVRRKRAKQMMRMANSMNSFFQPKSRWASSLRDRVASLVPDRLSERRMVDLYQLPFYAASSWTARDN